jgi:hypothetical protein
MTALGIHLTLSVVVCSLIIMGLAVEQEHSKASALLFLWSIVQIVTALLIRFS